MGVADFLRPSLPFLEFLPATADKFMRAQKYAAAWNAGKVLLPEQSEAHPVTWLDRFVDEHVNFTGVADAHDDIVDAAVAAFDVLSTVRENRPAEDESVAPRRM
jgi:predicted phage terminase large subunit-like protein